MPVAFGTEVDDEADPSIVGEYCLEERLGDGSYGTVYLANHARTHTNFAIKRIEIDKENMSHVCKKVRNEAKVMQEINHSHVVRLMKVMSSKTAYYFVMELAEEGELFNKVLKSKKFSESQARKYFQQLISAIHYCHSKNVIHRDLKAENLLLGKGGALKVCDFGFSLHNFDVADCDPGNEQMYDPSQTDSPIKFDAFGVQCDDSYCASGDESSLELTTGGHCHYLHDEVGTIGYMPPEMFTGGYSTRPVDGVQPADLRMHDLWAAGCILFFMLTGKLPFQGRGEQETVHNITNHIVSFDEVPVKARSFVQTMLAHNVKDRYRIEDIIAHEWFRVDLDESLFPSTSKQNPDKHQRSFLNFSMTLGRSNSTVMSSGTFHHAVDTINANGDTYNKFFHNRSNSLPVVDNTSPKSSSSQHSVTGHSNISGGSPTGQKCNNGHLVTSNHNNNTNYHHPLYRTYNSHSVMAVSSPTVSVSTDAGARSHIVPTDEEISLMKKAFQAIDVDNYGSYITPAQVRDMLYHLKGKYNTTQSDISFLLLFFGVVQSSTSENCSSQASPNASSFGLSGNIALIKAGKDHSGTKTIIHSAEGCDGPNEFFFSCAVGSTPRTSCSSPVPTSPIFASCPTYSNALGGQCGSKYNVVGTVDANGVPNTCSHRDALIQKLKRPYCNKQTSVITFEQFVSAWIEKDLGHMGGDDLAAFQIKPLSTMRYGTYLEKQHDIVNKTKDWKDVIGRVRKAFNRLDIHHNGLVPIEGFVQLFKEEGMLTPEEEAVAAASISGQNHCQLLMPSNVSRKSITTKDQKTMITFAEIIQLMKYLDASQSSSDALGNSLRSLPSFVSPVPIEITPISSSSASDTKKSPPKPNDTKLQRLASNHKIVSSPTKKRGSLFSKQKKIERSDSKSNKNNKIPPFSLTPSPKLMPSLSVPSVPIRDLPLINPSINSPHCTTEPSSACSYSAPQPNHNLQLSYYPPQTNTAIPQCITFYEFLDGIVHRDMLVTHPLGARLAKATKLDTMATDNRREQLCGTNGFTVHGTMKEVCKKISLYCPRKLALITPLDCLDDKMSKITATFALLRYDSDTEERVVSNDGGLKQSSSLGAGKHRTSENRCSNLSTSPKSYDPCDLRFSVKTPNNNKGHNTTKNIHPNNVMSMVNSPSKQYVLCRGRVTRYATNSPSPLSRSMGREMFYREHNDDIVCELDITFRQRSHSEYTAVSMRRISGHTTDFHEAVDLVTDSLQEAIDQAVEDTAIKGDSEFM